MIHVFKATSQAFAESRDFSKVLRAELRFQNRYEKLRMIAISRCL